MSLLHRVSSTESFSRNQPTGNSTPSETQALLNGSSQAFYDGRASNGRKLSFSPIAIPPTKTEREPLGAFEVSAKKRIAQVAVACIYCLFAAGIVFGYAAIKPVLIAEGVYREECTQKELESGEVCYKQELRLNFMFTVAAVSTNVSALPIGTILDRYGPKVASLIGVVFLTAGCFFMAFAWDLKPMFDAYILGYFCLALGGPFVFIPSFHLSNTFPRYSGLVLALLTGCFDTSSAIFLIYRLIYAASNGRFWPKQFFLIYLVVPAFILVAQIFLMPAASYKTVGELVAQAEQEAIDDPDDLVPPGSPPMDPHRRPSAQTLSEITSLLGGDIEDSPPAQQESHANARSGVWGALHGLSAWRQVCTPWFALITFFTLLQMTRINYFVATIRPQYEYLLGSAAKARSINDFFDVALPLGGVVAVPFIGLILDNISTAAVLGVLVAAASLIGVFGIIPHSMPAAYANVAFFVVYRPFYYTAVSDYSAKVFGFATFGKVYGLIICLAGLFNFSQSALDALTYEVFKRNPTPVNAILLTVTAIVGSSLSLFVWTQARKMRRDRLESEAEHARPTNVPGADPRVNQDRHPIDVHGSS